VQDFVGIRRAGYAIVVHSVQGYADVLGRDQLQRAMDLAAKGQRPPVAWRFIRDARSLLRTGAYRRAVIHAATVAELTLTTRVSAGSLPSLAGSCQFHRIIAGVTRADVTLTAALRGSSSPAGASSHSALSDSHAAQANWALQTRN
jgi:hypothetical protein